VAAEAQQAAAVAEPHQPVTEVEPQPGVSDGDDHDRGGGRTANFAGARRSRQPESGGGGDPR
jgi:hypothetical protein